MTGVLIAVGVVSYVGVLVWWMGFSMRHDFSEAVTFLGVGLWAVAGLGPLFSAVIEAVMPARHCAERGEWVE